jgi:hypothetical protein
MMLLCGGLQIILSLSVSNQLFYFYLKKLAFVTLLVCLFDSDYKNDLLTFL